MRTCLALLLTSSLVACSSGGAGTGGGGATPADPDRAASPADPVYKRLLLSLEILPAGAAGAPRAADAGDLQQVWIIMTDETGATERVDIGSYPGPCRDRSGELEGAAMDPLLGASCSGGEGVRLLVVQRDGNLVVLRALGEEGDELDHDEVQRVELPPGVPVSVDR